MESKDVDWKNLHNKSKEELLKLGFRMWNEEILLFPERLFYDIPTGMVVTSISGKKERFHSGFDNDTRGGVLAFGVRINDPEPNKSDYDEAKTFDEYYADYKNYDNGGELDQGIIADAKKVFEKLKTKEAIKAFAKATSAKQNEMVNGLDDGHSGFSLRCVCLCAQEYAEYMEKVAKEKELATKYQEYLAGKGKSKAPNTIELDFEEALEKVKFDKDITRQIMKEHPEMVEKLIAVKDKDGKQFFDALEIVSIMYNCGPTIKHNPERIEAIISNPEELEIISTWNSRGAGVWRASTDPLRSTVKIEEKIKAAKENVLSDNKKESKPRISREDLVAAAESLGDDKDEVLQMVDKHPEIVKLLSEVKDKKGKDLFTASDINYIFLNCGDTIENNPGRLIAVVSNPEEIADISCSRSKAYGVYRAVDDPLQSTIDRDPQAFGIKPKVSKEIEAVKSKILNVNSGRQDWS